MTTFQHPADSGAEPGPTPPPIPAPSSPDVPGLEVIEVIARGAHGTVYLANQADHDRAVALKVLDSRFVDDTARRRFDRERTALGRISDHPSIVSLFDSGYTSVGEPYLLLEYAAGGSLADRLTHGSLTFDEATALAVRLAAAVERMHEAGVIHRDIKPANVLRSAYGDWMLTDFGIASLVDRSATAAIHASYAHTAPETLAGEAAEATADVYALASVLATCLTGEEPFEMVPDEAPVSAMRRVASDPYPDLRRRGVPDDLAALLEMALSKDPIHRPVSAIAFAAAVNDVRESHGLMPAPLPGADVAGATVTVAASSPSTPRPSWLAQDSEAVSPSGGRRRVRMFAAAAALLLALVGLGTLLPTGPFDDVVEAVAGVVDDGGDADGADGDANGPGGGDGNGNDGDGPGGGDGNGNGGNGPGDGNGGNGPGNGGGGPGGGGGRGGNGPGGGGNGNGGGN